MHPNEATTCCPSGMTLKLVVFLTQIFLLLHCATGFIAPSTSSASRSGHSCSSGDSSKGNLAASPSNPMAAASSDLQLKASEACFGGKLLRYVHQSEATKTPMTFTVFLPPQASEGSPVPVCMIRSCYSVRVHACMHLVSEITIMKRRHDMIRPL